MRKCVLALSLFLLLFLTTSMVLAQDTTGLTGLKTDEVVCMDTS